ncbi:phage tail spike protein [Staphylococcus haemolyticus]|uniref:phage tail spike protein n=1 Tax=Staphylococcus haemolyticus TaxID=1283 RepID=UPI0025564E47|nr:phage tail spike protein [Staphylococcus haemolyticus]MDK7234197.1 phage tail spike protein [Staphylococcus haemolyticus]
MKNVGIHVLDFNDNIIDFISQSDGALINAEMSMNVEEKTETFDFTIENTRAEKLRERNRIIAQDNNGTFREFIIIHIADNFDGTTEIECNASYLEDLKTAKPIKPGKFEAHTTTQALLKTLADTGWEVSDDTEYGGNRTTSWTSHTNPFDLIYMLCTTYDMVPSFYIELGAHTVEHRYVSITKPKNLFKGKEITKGKDLTGMTRTIDLSEVKTALLAVGPEKEDGSRIETVVVDDEAQEIFGLPNRYIWDVYEPESNDENMTLKRLTTLAKTELNKRNQAAISYEVSSIDIHKYYNDVTVHLRDIVRVKDRDFRPPLYIEAEVIGIKYNWLADESEFTFGNVIEYEETKLREFFNRKLDEITKKLNDNISNVNTIVSDVVAGELEYYERKIFKGAEPPENPQNDTLWYDTSNPDVAVLRRYWNGEWITQTADDVEKIGGLRREQVMYRDLNNSFINLTIQHSQLQNDVYDVLNNEYLVDDDLKANLNQALSDVDSVYQNIKTNLDSMDEDTATIGKLVDTQTLFTVYREKLQTLYKYVTDAKISIDKRLKLLQSQYTDEKFNDAMDKIAQSLPNGRWDSENQHLYADIPNRTDVDKVRQTLQEYTDGQISDLNSILGKEIDSKINTSESKLSASISSVERKIDGIEVGGRNLIRNSEKITDYSIFANVEKAGTYSLGFEPHFTENIPSEFGVYYGGDRDILKNDKPRITHTFEVNEDRIGKDIRLFFGGSYITHRDFIDNGYVGKVKLEYGNVATDWTPAPEDIEDKILNSKQEAEEAAKGYAKAQDELKQKETQAYADGIVSDEEKRAIADAKAKRDEAKAYAEQKAQEAQEAANQNTSNQLEPITTRVTKNETNITELDSQISAMAKSEDVAQKLRDVDGRLTPLETTVKSNKATLDVLPTQIESKVSKQDYTTDKNNIVQRLDNADSERKQLSNEITDKVTITKFESGISEVKQESQNYAKNQANIAQQNAEKSAKAYTDAQDNLQLINAKAYADGKVTKEEERAIQDAKKRLEEAKIHADKSAEIAKQESQNYTNDEINNLDIGSENLLLDSESRSDGANTSTHSYIRYYLAHPLEIGKTYTLKANIVTTDERQSGKTSVYPFYPNGIRDTVDIKGGKIIHTFIAKAESTQFLIYKDVAGQSNVDLNVTIEKAILVEGDKVTGWAPANEDVKSDIQQAETNAKNYTDEYKRSNDIAMTKLETSITQNGDKIALKVDEQKFNASRKTLSQVIAEISATTKGINLSYDENGNIQSYTMDRNGIQLRGDKVDITVNKDFNVMANRVNDKVGKDEIINRLNLSPEGLDIDVNKVGIRGGDSTNYIYLSQDKIEMAGTFQRTFRGNTQKDNVFMRAQGGFLRFRNNNQNRSLYYSDFGISTYIDGDSSEASGTLQFFDYTYSPTNSVRGVTLNSAGGAIALNSERNRIVLDANATVNIESETSSVYIRPMKNNRAGTNEFRFWTKLNDSVADTDGVLSYGTITELVEKAPASYSFGSGIRFDKSPKSRYIYATDKDGNIGTGDFYARNLLGDWWAKNNNLYALVDPKEGKLRITDYNGYNNGSPKYKDLQCDDIQANSVRVNTGQNFYIGVSTNELWVTNNLRYNGGNTGFKPVRASDFIKASSAEFKHDIKKWDYDALNVISNELQLYSYKYNDDEKEIIHHGPVIGDGYDIPVEFVFNSGVNTNEMLSWALRAIQQLNEKINTLEEQLNEQPITS